MQVAGFAQERGACTVIRIRNPLEKIRQLGICGAYVIGLGDPNTDKAVNEADVLLLGRYCTPRTLEIVKKAQGMGKKVVYDLDDNILGVSIMSPHYLHFGTMSVEYDGQLGQKDYLWKDGSGGFDVRRNRSIRQSYIDIIRQADCVTVTTEPLAEVYRRFNDYVEVIPNAIDFNVWERPPYTWDKDEVRLIYTGAANHQEDWLFVSPTLAELQREYPQLKIILMGMDWRNTKTDLDYSRIEFYPWVDIEAYPHLMKTMCADIGICPISKIDFNESRSSIKWLEYSAVKAATVATDYGPYKRDMIDGKTGLLVSEREDWKPALKRLIEDKAYRQELALNAFRHCKAKYDLNYVCDQWVAMFDNVLRGN